MIISLLPYSQLKTASLWDWYYERITIYCSGDAKSGALLYSKVEDSTVTRKSAKALPMVIEHNSGKHTGDGSYLNG